MKCKRLVPMFKAVLDDGSEILLAQEKSEEGAWHLETEEYEFKVSEMYDVAKSILETSNTTSILTIIVSVFGDIIPITKQTTKEDYLNAVIGDKTCNSVINEYE